LKVLLERVSGVLEAGGSEVQRETPPLPEGAFKKGGCFQKTSRKRLLEKGGLGKQFTETLPDTPLPEVALVECRLGDHKTKLPPAATQQKALPCDCSNA
jgi:hypothetical protein